MSISLNKSALAALICKRLSDFEQPLKIMFQKSSPNIGYFFIDDLLPFDVVDALRKAFPRHEEMVVKKSMREFKSIAVQMNECANIIEEAVYAFQEESVLEKISKITEIDNLLSDPLLYAGGVSSMGYKNFLNPHLDNSHNRTRDLWRALNVLYYVTPDWPTDQGGNLELWTDGLRSPPTVIHSKFNRLVVMATHSSSWHSVSPVTSRENHRRCISNYYFRESSLMDNEKYHVTSFRGRPEQPIQDMFLRFDNAIRQVVRVTTGEVLFKNKHFYRK